MTWFLSLLDGIYMFGLVVPCIENCMYSSIMIFAFQKSLTIMSRILVYTL